MIRKLAFVLALVLSLSVFNTHKASADVNSFVIKSFNADITLTTNDPQGEMHIKETIKLTFSDNNHGILRAIPQKYEGFRLMPSDIKVSSPTGAPTEFTTYSENSNLVIQIGDPDRTVTGDQTYLVNYKVQNVIHKDRLIWNINGTDWTQTFEQVSVALHNKSGSNFAESQTCYTGALRSTASDCFISPTSDGFKAETTRALGSGENLTIDAKFPPGVFKPFSSADKTWEWLRNVLGFALPFLLVGGAGFWVWFRMGRDDKGRTIIVPQYDAPPELNPLVAGTLIDFKTENKDITATIIDLAIRHYIKIIETKKAVKFLPDTTTYKLVLQNADFSALSLVEAEILKALFTTQTIGEEVDLSEKASKLYKATIAVTKDAKSFLKKNGYYKAHAFFAGGMGRVLAAMTLGVVLVLIVLFVFIPASPDAELVVAGIISGGIVGSMFLINLAARTQKGTLAREHMLGLKMYLEVAEKDRIAKLQAPNAPYAAQANEPVKTVELFEKLLPYAIVLGVENKWAEQFKDLYTSPPDWYGGGNWTVFNSAILVSSLNSGVNAATSRAFATPSSSGSGSSGGFSGGGGGGGGGGGW